MSNIKSSYLLDAKVPVEVRSGSGKKVQVMMKPHQSFNVADNLGYRTFPIRSGSLPAAAFVDGSLIKDRIQSDSANKIRNAYLEIVISESGASSSMVLAPVWQWFERIEFWAENGSGDQIQRL